MAKLPSGSTVEGRRHGDPLLFGALIAAAIALSGCGATGSPVASGPRPVSSTEGAVARPLAVYEDLGLYAGSEDFPVVLSLSSFAGPPDSTYLLVGMSMPNRALRFRREDDGFAAEYEVAFRFERGGEVVVDFDKREFVRVSTFAETSRSDESVVFQTLFALAPGEYAVEMTVRDALGTREYEATDTIQVPEFGGEARLSPPLLVYQAAGRTGLTAVPQLLVNPRFTVPYGAESAQLYIEAYGAPEGQTVDVVVTDVGGVEVLRRQAVFDQGTDDVRYALLSLSSDSLPLGRLWLEVSADGLGEAPSRTPLLVTITDQWMVANFDEMLDILEYIASNTELDSLRNAQGVERREAWDRFWARRGDGRGDNTFRERFFERVRFATENFGEPGGRAGWRTDRGEVYIVLGPPDQVFDDGTARRDLDLTHTVLWVYFNSPTGRLELTFADQTGFGRYELTPTSRSAFRAAASRLRPPS